MINPALNFCNIEIVIALSGIVLLLCLLYGDIKARSWLWFIAAWVFVLFVRVWIMLKSLWPACPKYTNLQINALMAVGYTGLFFGFLVMVLAFRKIMREKRNNGNDGGIPGPPGPQGVQGIQGVQGVQGYKGQDSDKGGE
jgi:hypothetical protein